MTDATRTRGQTILIAVTMTLGALMLAAVLSGNGKSYRNVGRSMEPTLPRGSYVTVIRTKNAGRGDIVLFRRTGHEKGIYIKRVVAIEGDTVEIKTKELFVNGRKVDEPYVMHEDDSVIGDPRDNFGPLLVPAGTFFVLGDNRDNSADSRFWGPIPRDTLIGRPVVAYDLTRGVWRP